MEAGASPGTGGGTTAEGGPAPPGGRGGFVQDGARMVDKAMAILSASAESHKPVGHVRVIVPARFVERGTTRR